MNQAPQEIIAFIANYFNTIHDVISFSMVSTNFRSALKVCPINLKMKVSLNSIEKIKKIFNIQNFYLTKSSDEIKINDPKIFSSVTRLKICSDSEYKFSLDDFEKIKQYVNYFKKLKKVTVLDEICESKIISLFGKSILQYKTTYISCSTDILKLTNVRSVKTVYGVITGSKKIQVSRKDNEVVNVLINNYPAKVMKNIKKMRYFFDERQRISKEDNIDYLCFLFPNLKKYHFLPSELIDENNNIIMNEKLKSKKISMITSYDECCEKVLETYNVTEIIICNSIFKSQRILDSLNKYSAKMEKIIINNSLISIHLDISNFLNIKKLSFSDDNILCKLTGTNTKLKKLKLNLNCLGKNLFLPNLKILKIAIIKSANSFEKNYFNYLKLEKLKLNFSYIEKLNTFFHLSARKLYIDILTTSKSSYDISSISDVEELKFYFRTTDEENYEDLCVNILVQLFDDTIRKIIKSLDKKYLRKISIYISTFYTYDKNDKKQHEYKNYVTSFFKTEKLNFSFPLLKKVNLSINFDKTKIYFS